MATHIFSDVLGDAVGMSALKITFYQAINSYCCYLIPHTFTYVTIIFMVVDLSMHMLYLISTSSLSILALYNAIQTRKSSGRLATSSDKQLTYSTLMVIITSFVRWSSLIVHVIIDLVTSKASPGTIQLLSLFIISSSNLLNPIVYTCTARELRQYICKQRGSGKAVA